MSSASENYNTIHADKLSLVYQDEMLKKLTSIENLLRIQIPEGVPFPFTLTFTGGEKLTQIDFVRGNHSNLPTNANVKIPNRFLYSLTIINDGPGDINLGITQNAGDSSADLILKASDTPLTIRSGFNNYRFLNICAPTQASSARILAFI